MLEVKKLLSSVIPNMKSREIESAIDTQDAFWQAVQTKDARYDGSFVFAVKSTGIYCRPSCPSRLPKRDGVSFFHHPEAAEKAGFRACRRCRPNEALKVDPKVELVERVCRFLDSSQEETPTLAQMSAEVGVSPFHLQRTFKRLMGISPRQYAAAARIRRFKTGIHEGKSVTTALYDAGFGSSSRLYERTGSELGMTPAIYRRGGQGLTINYTTLPCELGRLLVAATTHGICAVRLGDTDEKLEADLRAEYPGAEIINSQSTLAPAVQKLLNYLAGKQPVIDLPLDIQATAFQAQVWKNLRAIPYGETRSYSELARAMGQPTAVRAVARACASNPVALIVPCHRVIRSDSSLGGYRWGIERKKRLLEQERKQMLES